MTSAGQRPVVSVRIERPEDIAARLPANSGAVSVPYLAGWSVQRFKDLAARIQDEFSRAFAPREARHRDLSTVLKSRIDEARDANPGASRAAVVDMCKRWIIDSQHSSDALEVLVKEPEAILDGAAVSAILDVSKDLGDTGRSRVVSALAGRLLQLSSALTFPEGVSRMMAAAKDLPWDSPAHEDVAESAVSLERELFYSTTPVEREQFTSQINGSVADLVNTYAHHPRVAVVEHVARGSERADLLTHIAGLAQSMMEIDPRLTFRLVDALASNKSTPVDILQPFAQASFWIKGEPERKALDSMLKRAMLRRAEPAMDKSFLSALEV